jgi:hypothetical protein
LYRAIAAIQYNRRNRPGERGAARGGGGDSGSPNMTPNNEQATQQPSNEMAKLLEMAGARLASGDYGLAMQYVLFAQTLHPL